MTIDEAFHRILRGHWLIIISCIVVPLSAAVLLGRNDADLYEAVARVQMGRDLAASNVQADATSQRVLGIATSPGVVRVALDKAGLQADVGAFAADHIDVRRVGVSPVMEIAVTDTSPDRAAIIAGSLTSDVIQFSNVGDQQTVEQRRTEVKSQLDGLDKQREQLVSRLSHASPGDVLAIQAQLSALTASQTEYERQLSDLDLAFLSSSRAVLLDPVRQPTIALPKDTPQKAILVALLGALVGLGLAATLETFRPRLPTPRAIARALDVPQVGHLPARDDSPRTIAAAVQVADRLALLARRYGAGRVFVVPVLARDEAWARSLAPHLGPSAGPGSHRLECSVLGSEWVDPGENPVAVVLTPQQLPARDLARTSSLVEALGWPVLGVVSYEPGRRRLRHAPAGDPGPAGSPDAPQQAEVGRPLERAEPVQPVQPVQPVVPVGPLVPADHADVDPVERPSAVDDEGAVDRVENEEVLRR